MNVLDQFRLDDKTALVTGCKRGIGKAIALAFAEAGANIIGVSSSLESSGSEIEKEIQKRGREFWGFQCDFRERKQLYEFTEKVKKNCPPVDILVNNAGMQFRTPVAEFPDHGWDQVMEVNLNAPFILAREFGRDMVDRGWGKVIFIASVISFQGGLTIPAYATSKGGVVQLVKSFSNEWASKGVNVNAVAPGYVNTEMNVALINDPQREPAITSRIPAARWATPEDFKGIAVFLASDASAYIHGSTIIVDGGWLGR